MSTQIIATQSLNNINGLPTVAAVGGNVEKTISVRVSDHMHAEIVELAKRRRVSRGHIIRVLLEDGLQRQKKNPKDSNLEKEVFVLRQQVEHIAEQLATYGLPVPTDKKGHAR